MQDDCGILIKRINDSLEKDANNSLRKYGLTISQAGILSILEKAGADGMPLKELEKQLYVKQPTAAGIISRMAKRGLLAYFENPNDKRAKNVRITEQGRAVASHGERHRADAERRLIASLSEDEQEIFHRCLQKICDSFE